jgi:hypothetical protein
LTDLFTAPTPGDTTTTPNIDNLVEALVGDGKKFKTVEELAKAKLEADRFIEQLKNENAGIRQELSTRQTLEELMDKVSSRERVPESTNTGHNQSQGGGDGQNGASKAFTEEDIARLVEERLSASEKARVHTANLETVQKALVASFGSDYVTHLKAKASELGVSEEYLNTMAKETPKAFLKLVEVDGAPKGTTPALFSPPATHGLPSSNKQGFTPTGNRKQSWYEDLRKRNPTEYWSPATQNRMHQEALSLGESFFDL